MTSPVKKDVIPKFDATASKESALEQLPPELGLMVVGHLMPIEAINFESVSRTGRSLIANNFQVWVQHGLRPPHSLNEAHTLKQAWLSRARTLAPEIQLALSALIRPLDIFSVKALERFSSSVRDMNKAMADIKVGIEDNDFHRMESAFDSALIFAEEAGVRSPTVFAEMAFVYLVQMKSAMRDIARHASTGSIDLMELSIWEVETCAKRTGTKMPPLPFDSIKSCYLNGLADYLSMAARNASKNDIRLMGRNLKDAAGLAKKAKVDMPSLSLEGVSQEAKAAYFQIVNALKSGT